MTELHATLLSLPVLAAVFAGAVWLRFECWPWECML